MVDKSFYPSTRKTTLGARLKVRILPFNIRTPTIYTITVNRLYRSNINQDVIYLTSNINVYLTSNTKLSFNGITVEVAEDVVINTTETPILILDLSPNTNIPKDSTSTTLGLLNVVGCKNFTISPEIQSIETTNVSHGIEKEEKQTFNSKKFSLELIEIYEDIGGLQFIDLIEDPGYRNSEFWFNLSYPDGSYKEGAGIITSASPTTNQQSIKSWRIEGRIQPNTYNYFYPDPDL